MCRIQYLVEIYEQYCCQDILCTSSSNYSRIVRICGVINRFFPNPFWFFSPSSRIEFKKKTKKKQYVISLSKFMPLQFLVIPKLPLWKRGEDAAFRLFHNCVLLCIRHCIIEEICRHIFWSFKQILSIFFYFCVKFFLQKLSEFDVEVVISIFWGRFIRDFWMVSEQIHEMLFFFNLEVLLLD